MHNIRKQKPSSWVRLSHRALGESKFLMGETRGCNCFSDDRKWGCWINFKKGLFKTNMGKWSVSLAPYFMSIVVWLNTWTGSVRNSLLATKTYDLYISAKNFNQYSATSSTQYSATSSNHYSAASIHNTVLRAQGYGLITVLRAQGYGLITVLRAQGYGLITVLRALMA